MPRMAIFTLLVMSFAVSHSWADWDNDYSFPGFYVEKDHLPVKSIEDLPLKEQLSEFTPIYEFKELPDGTIEEEVKVNKPMKFFSWVPSGETPGSTPYQCHFSHLSAIMAESVTMPNFQKNSKPWLDRCLPYLSYNQKQHSLLIMLRAANIKYDIRTISTLRPVMIILDHTTILRGILAVKPDNKKRPMVIIKCGIYCNAQDSGNIRSLLMHYYEQSDFNVLFLGNVTGTDYLKDNGIVAIGGFDEGRQIIKVAEILKGRFSKFKDKISDIHSAGYSLGGNAALFSALYNSFLKEPLLASTTAICPVVNLQPTMKSVFSKSLRGFFYRLLTANTLKEVFFDVPILSKYLNIEDKWSQSQLYKTVSESAFKHYQLLTKERPWDMEPFQGLVVDSLEKYWHVNNFVNFSHMLKTPTLVIHSEDDYMVQSEFNADTLLSKHANDSKTPLAVVSLKKGNHCAFDVAYGWSFFSALTRGFINNYTANPVPEPRKTYSLAPLKNLKRGAYAFPLEKHDVIVKQYFELDEGRVYMKHKVFKPNKHIDKCKYNDPYKTFSMCYDWYRTRIPTWFLKDLQLPVKPSKHEKQRLVRWLNTHSTLLNNRQANNGTSIWPNAIELSGDMPINN